MFHPWAVLGKHPHVDLNWVRMGGRLGQTNGRDRIDLNPDQYQVERRCTLTHELVHLELGHTTRCHPRVEARVCAETARRLIDIATLVDAWRWSTSLDEIADHCWVTRAVLQDRLAHLTPDEQQQIADAILARDESA